MSIKQAFLDNSKKLTEIKIEELGVTAYLKKWSVLERSQIIPLITKTEKLETEEEKIKAMNNVMADVVCANLKNEDGSKVFDEEDLELLQNSDAEMIENIFQKILEINGMGEQKEIAKK